VSHGGISFVVHGGWVARVRVWTREREREREREAEMEIGATKENAEEIPVQR
jgi:hypothetical protein